MWKDARWWCSAALEGERLAACQAGPGGPADRLAGDRWFRCGHYGYRSVAGRATWRGAPMPLRGPNRWTSRRERQYEHIKEGLEQRGRDEDEAEEIAARTVNKERARAGEARQSSRSSIDAHSAGRRGGLRWHKGRGGRTYRQVSAEA